jgi:hypothetical protein
MRCGPHGKQPPRLPSRRTRRPMAELIALAVVLLIGVSGYVSNCYMAGRWLTWKQWDEFNGD